MYKKALHGIEKGIGTKATGFAEASEGPFKCGNCRWFKDVSCGHPAVIADAEMDIYNGRAVVDVDDCCNLYRPKGS